MMRRTIISAISAVLLCIVPAAGVVIRAQAPSGPREGIVVHGHWVIDVRDPDGRLVTHREFENALMPTGSTMVADVLSGRRVPAVWSVALASTGITPCPGQGDKFSSTCDISPVLAADGLVLTGVVTANRAGSIDIVQTAAFTCTANYWQDDAIAAVAAALAAGRANTTPPPYQPISCAQYIKAHPVLVDPTFSSATIAPIAVVGGQNIQVKVTFTFS